MSSLTGAYAEAARLAIATAANAYCPYSRFTVGAALVHPDNTVTAGCNWENASFQVTCAERCAIVAANALGKRQAVACAVYGRVMDTDPDPEDKGFTTPCGLCRQFLMEVAQLTDCDMDIIMVSRGEQHVTITKLSELLPNGFGPKDVFVDVTLWSKAGTKPPGSPTAKPSRTTSSVFASRSADE